MGTRETGTENVDAVLLELLESLDADRTLDRESLIERHPEYAAELREFFEGERIIENLAGPVVDTDNLQAAETINFDSAAVPDSDAKTDPVPRDTTPGSVGDSRSAGRTHVSSDIGEMFGRYRIIRTLGEGAMGSVHLAEDTVLLREVALKLPKFGDDEPELLERFLVEARAAANLRHPNICPVHDVGDVDGRSFITMSYIPGRPLSDYAKARPQKPRQVVKVVRKLAIALHTAHEAGIVHRDVKPANVMIDESGEPVVMDFGLARQTTTEDVRLTRSGAIMGTPAYMSPEQVEGRIDDVGPASDQFSLGAVLYEMLTGTLPFPGTSMGVVMSMILNDMPAPPSALRPEVDADLDAICLRMMEKDATKRYESLGVAAGVLNDWLAQDKSRKTPPPETRETAEFDRSDSVPSGNEPNVVTSNDDSSASMEPGDPKPAASAADAAPQPGTKKKRRRQRSKPAGSSAPPCTTPTAAKKPPGSRWPLIAGGLAGAAAIVLGLVLLFRTPYGTLKITVDDPNLTVVVEGENEPTITLTDQKWNGRRKAGKHRLSVMIGETPLPLGEETTITLDGEEREVKLDVSGVTLSGNEFEIARNGETAVTIRLIAAPVAEDEGTPASEDAITPADGWVALVPLVDPSSDARQGSPSLEGDGLRFTAAAAEDGRHILEWPIEFHGAYRLRVDLRPHDASQVGLMLPAGETNGEFNFVTWTGFGSLNQIDGLAGRGNPTHGKLLPHGLDRIVLEIDVQPRGDDVRVTVRHEGKAVLDWSGPRTSLKNEHQAAKFNASRLAMLCGGKELDVTLLALDVKVLDGSATLLPRESRGSDGLGETPVAVVDGWAYGRPRPLSFEFTWESDWTRSEHAPASDAEGLTLVFTDWGQLYMCERDAVGEAWPVAQNVDVDLDGGFNCPQLSADGLVLVFQRRSDSKGAFRLMVSRRERRGQPWSPCELLDVPVETKPVGLVQHGSRLVVDVPGEAALQVLDWSEESKAWGKPRAYEGPRFEGNVRDVFLAHDERTFLYTQGKDLPAGGRVVELFVQERDPRLGVWRRPRSLRSVVPIRKHLDRPQLTDSGRAILYGRSNFDRGLDLFHVRRWRTGELRPPADMVDGTLRLDGNEQRVEIGSLQDWMQTSDAHTIEVRVRVTGDRGNVFRHEDGQGRIRSLAVFNEGVRAAAYDENGKGSSVYAKTELPRDRFAHLAMCTENGKVRLYVDGKPAGRLAPEAEQEKWGRQMATIGGFLQAPDEFADMHLAADIDELRLSNGARYDEAFEPAERFEPDGDTVALYHFDEGRGDTLVDASGNGHHGKVVGAKWVRVEGGEDESFTFPQQLADLATGSWQPLATKPADLVLETNHGATLKDGAVELTAPEGRVDGRVVFEKIRGKRIIVRADVERVVGHTAGLAFEGARRDYNIHGAKNRNEFTLGYRVEEVKQEGQNFEPPAPKTTSGSHDLALAVFDGHAALYLDGRLVMQRHDCEDWAWTPMLSNFNWEDKERAKAVYRKLRVMVLDGLDEDQVTGSPRVRVEEGEVIYSTDFEEEPKRMGDVAGRRFHSNGVYRMTNPPGAFGWNVPVVLPGPGSIDLTGRVVDGERNGWGVNVMTGDRSNGDRRGALVTIGMDGVLQVRNSIFNDVGGQPASQRVEHPAIRPGSDWNRLVVRVGTQSFDVFVNGAHVLGPIETEWTTTPAKIALAQNTSEQERFVEFDSVVVRHQDASPPTLAPEAAGDQLDRQPTKTLTGHAGTARDVTFTPDGKTLVSSSYDGTIRLWDVATGREVASLQDENFVYSVDVSSDGKWLVSGGKSGKCRLWDLEKRTHVRDLFDQSGFTYAVQFSPNDQFVASGTSHGKTYLHGLADDSTTKVDLRTEGVRAVRFSPDGRRLLSIGYTGDLVLADSSGAAKVVGTIDEYRGTDVQWLSDDVAFTSSDDLVLREWNLAKGTSREVLKVEGPRFDDFALIGATHVAIASTDGVVQVHEITSGRVVRRLVGFSGMPMAVAVSPDGKMVAAACKDRTVRLWDVADLADAATVETTDARSDHEEPDDMMEEAEGYGPWSKPRKLGPEINSQWYDGRPHISGDDLWLLFASDRPGGHGGLDLWGATRPSVEKPFGPPVNLGPAINTSATETSPALSRDGLLLVFARDGDLWTATRPNVDARFERPTKLGPKINTSHGEAHPSLTADGLTLVWDVTREDGLGRGDIWVSRRASAKVPFTEAEVLGFTKDSEADPSISADGTVLYYARKTGRGQKGVWSLKARQRSSADTPWGDRVALGSEINIGADTRSPAISYTGRTLVFSSYPKAGRTDSDIWFVEREARGRTAESR